MRVNRARGKMNPILEERNGQPSAKEEVDEEAKNTRHAFLNNMDAIARGVEAQFEDSTGFSRRATETTINIARALGIPEAEIKRWAASRLIHDTKKLNAIKALLAKLQESFLGQADNERPPRRTI